MNIFDSTHSFRGLNLALLFSLSVGFSVPVQTTIPSPVYVLIPTNDGYKIIQPSLDNNSGAQLIYSISLVSDKTLSSDPLLESEAQFAQKIFNKYPGVFSRLTIADVLQKPLYTSIGSLAVSPDGTQIALPVSYETCFASPGGMVPECFGSLNILLISISDHRSKVIAEIPYHSLDYLPPECQLNQQGNLDSPLFRIGISGVKWLKNSNGLIIAISPSSVDTPNCPADDANSATLLWLSTAKAKQPVYLTSALAWNIDPDKSSLIAIESNCQPRLSSGLCRETLVKAQFLSAGQVSSSFRQPLDFTLEPGSNIESLLNGDIVYLGFTLATDDTDSVSAGIVVIAPNINTAYVTEVSFLFPKGINKLKASSDQRALFAQDGERHLWIISPATPKPILLSPNPVDDWWVINHGIIVHYSGETQFTLFSDTGQYLSRIDLTKQASQMGLFLPQNTSISTIASQD